MQVVVEKFKEAGRPITLGFITYKPPDLQEYDQVRHNPTQPQLPDKTISNWNAVSVSPIKLSRRTLPPR